MIPSVGEVKDDRDKVAKETKMLQNHALLKQFQLGLWFGSLPPQYTHRYMWKWAMPMCPGLQENDPRLKVAQTVGLRVSYPVPSLCSSISS